MLQAAMSCEIQPCINCSSFKGFFGGSGIKNWEDPLEMKRATTSILIRECPWAWEPLAGYSPWGRKATTQQIPVYSTLLPINSLESGGVGLL